MRSRSTWVWLAIAVVLFAIVFGVEKFWRKPPPGLVALLPEFKAEAVKAVQFALAGQPEIRVERTNDTWRMVKPISYPAQAASVDALLRALERLAPANTISAAEVRERIDPDSEFGFDKRTTLTLHTDDYWRQLILGAHTAPGDQIYVQVVGTEGVFVVDARLLQLLPAQPDDWRDTGLVDLRNLFFDHIIVSNAATVLHLAQENTNSLWRITAPLSARADNFRLAELLQQLHATRVASFVTDDPRGDLETFGLNAPELEVNLIHGTNSIAAVQFGRSPTNDSTLVYARRADSPAVVTVERRMIEPWLAPLEKFRDPYLVTRQRMVDEIEVRGTENFTLQRVSSNAWKLVDSPLPMDPGFVGQFLLTFVAAPILEYKDSITEADLPKYGLAEPSRRIRLRGKASGGNTNSLIAEILLGDMKEGVAYVRRTDENPIYGIGTADFARLSVAPWRLRDRQIWRFDVTNVVRVVTRQENRVIDLRRLGEKSWTFGGNSQGILNGAAVEEAVHRFGELDALEWVGCDASVAEKFGFNPASLIVTFELKDGAKYQIEFGGKSPDDYPYAMVKIGEEPWFFEFPLVPFELLKFYVLNAGSSQ